jgi:hypothetical protein
VLELFSIGMNTIIRISNCFLFFLGKIHELFASIFFNERLKSDYGNGILLILAADGEDP